MKIAACAICGQSFWRRRRQVTCSIECRQENLRVWGRKRYKRCRLQRLAISASYRERHREEIREKDRLYVRKNGAARARLRRQKQQIALRIVRELGLEI